ncbi:hypothetical protein GQ53DRAFT_884955 [Thozetella sp. PMI_491]|nr:hypothetical protein GQ53DRAFT_884955 [Thozetella sp. PMI_491]
MAPNSQEIQQEVWEQHKETIIGLRYGENLPLDSAKSGGRNMIQVMRDEHQFQATVSQYETQLKKWAAVKNLKKRDWETILPIYDELNGQGLEPRIRLGTCVLDESRIKRARRYDKRRSTALEGPAEPAAPSARSSLWSIEVRRSDGQYTKYSVKDGMLDVPEVSISSALVLRNMNNSLFEIESQTLQGDLFGWLPESPPIASLLSPQLANFPLAITSPQNTLEPLNDNFRPLDAECMLSELSFLDSHEWDLASPSASAIYNFGPRLPQWTLSKECIDMMLWSISQEPRFRFTFNAGFPDAQMILDNLTSLVDDDFFKSDPGETLALVFRGRMATAEIHKRVFFSIVNNFAGLHQIPHVILFGILRVDPDISSCLFESLRSDDLTIAKPLAVNLFRAAIEAGDDEAVNIILTITSGRINQIHPDRVVCEYKGRAYTPLALASRLHHFRIVQILLSHGASVCITSNEPNHYFIGCALEAIIPVQHRKSTEDIPELVQASTEITKILFTI